MFNSKHILVVSDQLDFDVSSPGSHCGSYVSIPLDTSLKCVSILGGIGKGLVSHAEETENE